MFITEGVECPVCDAGVGGVRSTPEYATAGEAMTERIYPYHDTMNPKTGWRTRTKAYRMPDGSVEHHLSQDLAQIAARQIVAMARAMDAIHKRANP
jgi:hypothetical protein